MDVSDAYLLTGAGAFAVAALLGALGSTYRQLAAVGSILGLASWGFLAIVIFRGPDNPDLGETGWTIFVGFHIVILLGVWLLGAATGRVLRRLGERT